MPYNDINGPFNVIVRGLLILWRYGPFGGVRNMPHFDIPLPILAALWKRWGKLCNGPSTLYNLVPRILRIGRGHVDLLSGFVDIVSLMYSTSTYSRIQFAQPEERPIFRGQSCLYLAMIIVCVNITQFIQIHQLRIIHINPDGAKHDEHWERRPMLDWTKNRHYLSDDKAIS